MKALNVVLLVIVAIATYGCATAPQQAAANLTPLKPGSGRLVVFRESGMTAMFAGPSIYVNGHELGKLYPKNFVEAALEPGEYDVKSEGGFWNWPGPARNMRVDIKPNATSYLELVVQPGGGPAIVNHYYRTRSDSEARSIVEKLERVSKP